MKIIADPQTRTYELTYLLTASSTDAELQAAKEAVAAVLSKQGATVTDTQDWGKKPLAYALTAHKGTHREAVYVHVVFEVLPEKMSEIDQQLKLTGEVLRHLLVVSESEK